MDVRIGDVLIMKKPHPCGCNRMIVLRSGADFKLSCEKCERVFMSSRSNIEKSIKKIERNES
ncbi:MAG: DUF951 domain-containing protein [Oscillospiraceae bacterium]|nr:DUF951 domain-containing protein [Oscillospiraceae bacterium]